MSGQLILIPFRANRRVVLAAIAAVLVFSTAVPVRGQGVIICKRPHEPSIRRPDRRPIHSWTPFAIKSQRVDVVIDDARAETTLEQVFVNRSRRPAEGKYLFPISVDASVHDLSMWMNGREVTGELLDADKARKIYQSIVSKMKDPALLEYTGRGLIQASVFPIPAGGECRIKLRYTEPVRRDSGLAGYRFPLRGGACSHQPIERFSLRAVIRSDRSLSSVFSPTHECSIDRRGEREVVVGFERTNVMLENDFQVFNQTGEGAFGLSMLTHRTPGEDGFFMARISPKYAETSDILPKNICFVLDTSGSMADDNKIAQARKALKFCVTNLESRDRFSIVSFATEVKAFRDGWVTADEANKSAARSFIDDLKAVGGTDIDAALRHALGMNPGGKNGKVRNGGPDAPRDEWRKSPFMVVFITDGEPTVGVTDVNQIVKNVAGANAGSSTARVFVLGVGFQVNTKLLDRLSDENGGAGDYVTPSENLELKMSAFYTKLAHPILTNLSLAFQGVSVHDLYPRKLSDLFKGSELVLMGRYGGASDVTASIELKGRRRGEPVTHRYGARLPVADRDHNYLPRLWATRKIGYLLNELRLHGEKKELKDEVVRLSKKYGIMTPYTSYLVQEDERVARRRGVVPASGRFMPGNVNRAFAERDDEMEEARDGFVGAVGKASVAQSKSAKALRFGGRAAPRVFRASLDYLRDKEGNQPMQFVGSKTFYRDGERWIDSDFDGKTEPVRIETFTDRYFDLLAEQPGIGPFAALGVRVVVSWRGTVYEFAPGKPQPLDPPAVP